MLILRNKNWLEDIGSMFVRDNRADQKRQEATGLNVSPVSLTYTCLADVRWMLVRNNRTKVEQGPLESTLGRSHKTKIC